MGFEMRRLGQVIWPGPMSSQGPSDIKGRKRPGSGKGAVVQDHPLRSENRLQKPDKPAQRTSLGPPEGTAPCQHLFSLAEADFGLSSS